MGEEHCWAIVPAAGVGSRLGAHCPKQYLSCGGKSIIERTLAVLQSHVAIKEIVVVLQPQDQYWQQLSCSRQSRIMTAVGGATRTHSVLHGLLALKDKAESDDWVLVHDAVRPFVSIDMIDRLLAAVVGHAVGGLLGMPVSDTVKQVALSGEVEMTHVRESIWLAQTPQVFRYGILCQALRQALDEGMIITDESSAVERLGLQPKMVTGDRSNIKVTTWEDMAVVKARWPEESV